MSESNYGLWGGIGSFFLVVVGLLGFKSRMDNLDKDKVDVTAFNQFERAQKADHDRIEKNLDKLFEKMEQVHKDMPKRKSDG